MELLTARLRLREFREDDWPAVLAYQRDPRYLRFYEWEGRTAEAARAFVRLFLAQQQEEPRTKFQLAVTRREGGELIGNVGIRLPEPGSHEAEIGYELAPEQWGHGYATEAARAIVAFGFGELALHRISAECVADNVASARVLRKLGMTLEGYLRHKQWYKERWWDTLLFAILEDEWSDTSPETFNL